MIRPGWLIHYPPPFFFISSGIKLFRGLLERRLTKLGLVTQPLPKFVFITPPPLMSQPRRLGWPQQTDGICMEGPGKHSITGIWFKQSTISLFIIRRHFGSSPPRLIIFMVSRIHHHQNLHHLSPCRLKLHTAARERAHHPTPPTSTHPTGSKRTHHQKRKNSVLKFTSKSRPRKKKL